MIYYVIKEYNTGTFTHILWRPTGLLIFTEGGNKLVENNTDHDVIGVFIEEFYGSDCLERDLAIGIGMSCSLIRSGYCKP